MSFKEYQLRNIKSKSFTASTALVPLNRSRDERNMMIVPYGYKPNYRLRHATNSSFIESMKHVQIERRTHSSPAFTLNVVEKINSSGAGHFSALEVNSSGDFAGETTTIDESAEEFIHELSSNESPKHAPKSNMNDPGLSSSSIVGNSRTNENKTDLASLDNKNAKSSINVKNCGTNSAVSANKESVLVEGTDSNRTLCYCVLSFLFPLFLTLLLSVYMLNFAKLPFLHSNCLLSRTQLISQVQSSDVFLAMKLNVIGQNDLIDNLTSTLTEFLKTSDSQGNDVLMMYIFGRSGVGKTYTVQTVLRHLGVDPFCVGTCEY